MTSWLSIAIRLIVVFTFLFGLPVIAIWGPPTWGPIKKWSLAGESPASLGLGYGTSNTQNHDYTVQQTNSQKTTPRKSSKLPNVSRLPPTTYKQKAVKAHENRFLTIQERLRTLGARYYRLETWEDGQSFHFVCRIAEGESAKIYEAHGSDPLGTMEKVLKQVEIWKNPQ